MMLSYIRKRIVINVISLWVIITCTFFIIQWLPGDPFHNESGNILPQETLDALKGHYGLNQPIWKQYVQYINALLHGHLGQSLVYKDWSVVQIIKTGFPVSAALGLESACIAIIGGVLIGLLAATKPRLDGFVLHYSIIQLSFPSFILATMLQYCFAVRIPIFPIACWGSLMHTVLPALSLSLTPMAFIIQLTRSSVKHFLKEDFILLAYAKGIPHYKILFKHVIPYSLSPIISYAAFLITTVITGTFAVENIFGIPGMGKWFISSVLQRDYPVIMGLTIFYSIIFTFASLISDIINTILNPRLKITYQQHQ